MKASFIVTMLALTSSSAFAGTMGRVSCSDDQGKFVALYSWFNSQADSWSNLVLFSRKSADRYTQYDANGDKALQPITVKTKDGELITVKPYLKKSTCIIQTGR